jgi:hypothetical protein
MTDDQFQEMMAQTRILEQSGQHEEVIRMLKTMVDGAPEVEDRLWAAGLIASIINFNYQHLVRPGTSQYDDVRRYLRIALESYDQAHPAAQEMYRNMPNNIPELRRTLSLMDQGQQINISQKKAGCFIATAAYGSALAPEVRVLSVLRDEVLLHSRTGARFVKLYYTVSPFFAAMIASTELLRFVTRNLLLRPILSVLRLAKFYPRNLP